MNPQEQDKQTVICTIVGRPNAGKSTLLNQLIHYRLSIVTPKAQTTRNQIKGVLNQGDTQFIFYDTPGLFTPHTNLEKLIVKAAWDSMKGADVVVLLLDGMRPLDEELKTLAVKLAQTSNLIIAINKSDVATKLDELRAEVKSILPAIEPYAISASTGQGIKKLLEHIKSFAVKSSWLYDEDLVSPLPLKFLTAEITREQLFKQLGQELPYNLTVQTENIKETGESEYTIRQVIVVSRENHKKIILGKGGEKIKAINQAARKCIEEYLGIKSHLYLFVSVKDWLKRPQQFV